MSASGTALNHLPAPAPCTTEHHDRLKRDFDAWSKLAKLPPMLVPPLGDEPGFLLDLRNCPCGSTLAIEATAPMDCKHESTALVSHIDNGGRSTRIVCLDCGEDRP